MIQELRVQHVEHVTTRSFEQVVTASERVVGSIEVVGRPALPGRARDEGEFQNRVEEHPGPRGGRNVPVRLVIDRDDASSTRRLAYDGPSTLVGNIAGEACLAAARGHEGKLAALAEQVTGTAA